MTNSGNPIAEMVKEATAHMEAGNPDKALDVSRRILARQPGNPEVLNLGAMAMFQLGDMGGAFSMMRNAIEANPGYAGAHNNLGTMLKSAGDLEGAKAAYVRAVAVMPEYHLAHYNLGVVLEETGKPEAARDSFRRALAINPDHAGALGNLGAVEMKLGNPDAAEKFLRRALEVSPGHVDALYNLGAVMRGQGNANAALEFYDKALALNPTYVKAHINRGMALQDMGKRGEAMKAYERALEIMPDSPKAHQNRGVLLLLEEKFAEGWEEYEWRFRVGDFHDRDISFPQPALENHLGDGSPLSGKRILVWSEQGIGDELQFAGMIPDLAEAGAKVLLECDFRLLPLFVRSFPSVECVAKADPPDQRLMSVDIDFQSPAGSLSRFLRPGLASFPKHEGYLTADAERTKALRARYGGDDSFLVGVSWGSTDPKRPEKVLPLSGWRPLLEVPGVTFVNLQYGDTAEERAALTAGTGVEILHDETVDPLVDLDGFAAQVAAMDLVVSICNTTIHMAGALGVPGWVLVPFVPDWRWLLDREDSPWYPSLRLFRQSSRNDWGDVMARLSCSLPDDLKGGK